MACFCVFRNGEMNMSVKQCCKDQPRFMRRGRAKKQFSYRNTGFECVLLPQPMVCFAFVAKSQSCSQVVSWVAERGSLQSATFGHHQPTQTRTLSRPSQSRDRTTGKARTFFVLWQHIGESLKISTGTVIVCSSGAFLATEHHPICTHMAFCCVV